MKEWRCMCACQKNRRRKNLGTRRSLRMQKGKIHVPNVGVGDTWRDAQFSFHIKVFTSPFFFWVAISIHCGTSAP